MAMSNDVRTSRRSGHPLARGSAAVLLMALAACSGRDGGEDTQYPVTVAVTGSGTVTSSDGTLNCGAQCSTTLRSGSVLALSATPGSGFNLQTWGGACAGSSGNTCTVTVNQATTIAATFAQNPPQNFVLTVGTVGNGSVSSNPAGINCGTTCSASFAANSAVALAATPAAGQTFNGWSGACTGTTSPCTVSMSAARSVTATFVAAPVSQSLALTISGSGTVTSSPAGINCSASCSANFDSGTSVTLTAAPASGFVFGTWAGACSGSSTSCSVVVSAPTAVSATFQPQAGSVGWDDERLLGADNAEDVRVVIDAAGNATAAWTFANTGGRSIIVSRSIAGGAWTAPLEIDGSTTESMGQARLAVDPASGRIMALWIEEQGFALFGNTFVPATGWGTAQLVQRRPTVLGAGVRNHRIAIDGVGEAIAVWDMRDTSNELGIFASRYALASGWSTPATIESNAGSPAFVEDQVPVVAMLANGRAIAVWQSLGAGGSGARRGLWSNTFTPSTGWGTASELVGNEAARRVMRHELKADLQGNAVLGWSGFDRNQSAQEVHEMFSRRFTGAGWDAANTAVGPRLIVTSLVPSEPYLSVSGAGQSVLGWTIQDRALRASVASSGGAWGAAAEVKAASTTLDVSNAVTAIDAQGNAFAAWTQTNSAAPELWISRFTAGAGWSAPARHQQTPSTIGNSSRVALAMNDRGNAVIVWYQIDERGVGSLRSRYYRSGR